MEHLHFRHITLFDLIRINWRGFRWVRSGEQIYKQLIYGPLLSSFEYQHAPASIRRRIFCLLCGASVIPMNPRGKGYHFTTQLSVCESKSLHQMHKSASVELWRPTYNYVNVTQLGSGILLSNLTHKLWVKNICMDDVRKGVHSWNYSHSQLSSVDIKQITGILAANCTAFLLWLWE